MKYKEMEKRIDCSEWQSGVYGIVYHKSHNSWKVTHRNAEGIRKFLGCRHLLKDAKLLLISYERHHGASTVGDGLVGKDSVHKKPKPYTKDQKALQNELWKKLI